MLSSCLSVCVYMHLYIHVCSGRGIPYCLHFLLIADLHIYFLMIQVHTDGTKIRRSVSKPLAEMGKEHQDSMKLRFVYAVSFLCCLMFIKQLCAEHFVFIIFCHFGTLYPIISCFI